MIRKSTNNDLEKIMQIWLDTNISVHNYIPQEYWTSNEKYVKEAIQEAEVYVYEEKEQFKPIKEDVDEANNEVEILMEWKKN